MRHRSVLWLGIITASLPVLAACESSGDAKEVDQAGPVLVSSVDWDGNGMSAVVEGRLRLSNGCLLLDDVPVVWPYGTSWDIGAQEVLLPSGASARLGRRVTGGGGYFPGPDAVADVLGDALAEAVRRCPTDQYGQVAVFNPDEDVVLKQR